MNNTLKWILIALAVIACLAFGAYKMISYSGILDPVNPEEINQVRKEVQSLKNQNADFKTCTKSYKGELQGLKGVMSFTMWAMSCAQEIPLSTETCALVPKKELTSSFALKEWAIKFCTELEITNVDTCGTAMSKIGPRVCPK